VLVVDDSSIWRRFIIEHLCEAGLTAIDVAHDGVQAVRKARTLQLDLILMDVALPRMNGIEAAAAIRKVAPAVKIVFVSANSDPDVRLAALNAGGSDYVLKSPAVFQLMGAIKLVLRSVP
jgi:CheY-like chemotaxis protein